MVSSSGQVGMTSTLAEKDTCKGDSGSSDDVLTISLGKERKRDAKKRRKNKSETPVEEGSAKRKRVSFSMDKNMTRGKPYFLVNFTEFHKHSKVATKVIQQSKDK